MSEPSTERLDAAVDRLVRTAGSIHSTYADLLGLIEKITKCLDRLQIGGFVKPDFEIVDGVTVYPGMWVKHRDGVNGIVHLDQENLLNGHVRVWVDLKPSQEWFQTWDLKNTTDNKGRPVVGVEAPRFTDADMHHAINAGALHEKGSPLDLGEVPMGVRVGMIGAFRNAQEAIDR